MSNILDEIKASFKEGSYLTRLIYINIGIFVIVKLVTIPFNLFNIPLNFSLVHLLAVPADLKQIIFRPWTPLTYMFLHEGFLHILFNLLILFWFGKIFLMFLDQKKLLSVYLLGGFAGAFLFVLAYNIFPLFRPYVQDSICLGASAAVMAIVISIALYKPDFEIYLVFIGPVKLKYIAIFYIVLDILSIASANAGGHIAHLGGALYGFLYIKNLKSGKNISSGFDQLLDSVFTFFKPRKKLKIKYKKPVDDYEYNEHKAEKRKEMDKILDKISKYGYDSLTKKEKEILFKMGDRP